MCKKLETIEDRIRFLRGYVNKSQAEFAESVGLTKNYISLVETGKRNLAERTAKDICRIYKVNYQWLLHGDGDMLMDDEDARDIIDSVISSDNEFAKRILLAFSRLDECQWRVINELLNDIIGKGDPSKEN
jgi:transcriptional regulator with XRE-family HTH domain